MLTIRNGTNSSATFQSTNGVGPATPGVLDASANVYGDGYASARITSTDSPLIADATLPQMVITMWIKPTISPSEQPNARLLNISPADAEKGAPGLYIALNKENLDVGMNGMISQVLLPEGSIRKGEWTFLALVYDGATSSPYYSNDMLDVLQTTFNAAVIIGGRESGARPGAPVAISTGAPSYSVTPGPFALNGLCVGIGSGNSNGGHSFVGFIDDVRIYSGLMTIKQLEAIRQSSLATK